MEPMNPQPLGDMTNSVPDHVCLELHGATSTPTPFSPQRLCSSIDTNSNIFLEKVPGKTDLEVLKSAYIRDDKEKTEFRNYEDSDRQAIVEKTYRDQHTNQTVEFVKEMRSIYFKFQRTKKTVWEMGMYLNSVVDESDPDTNLSQLEHAIQTGEAARALFPGEEYDWLHCVAFIHDFGKVLLVEDPTWGAKALPQWAVVGDIFPVGCKFDEKNIFHDSFKYNPDTKDVRYNTACGMYEKNVGLENVLFCWGHDDYMYEFARRNAPKLPEAALYMLRYHSFYPWHQHNAYMHLCNKKDVEMLEWVKKFQKFDLYSKSTTMPTLEEVGPYYKKCIEKYFGTKPLAW